MRPLTIFISHSSELFTDHRSHGDGLIAHGFVTRLAELGHRLHVLAEQVDLQKPLHPNITLHPILPRYKSSLLQRLDYLRRSRQILHQVQSQEHVDIIHQLNPVYAGASLAFIGTRTPIVLGCYGARWPNDPDALTTSDSLSGRLLEQVRDWITAAQQRRAAALLLSSPAAMNQIPDGPRLRDRFHCLPYGSDSAFFTPATGWDSPARQAAEQQHPIILFLANIHRRKGIFDLLEAFETIAPEFPNCTLRIAGGGGLIEEARAIAAHSPAASQIDFAGPQTRAGALEAYRACTIFCSPSHGEPFGMTPIEAMGCARPVVVTRLGGPAYSVHPSGGILIPPWDPTALAEALQTLLRNPALRLSMGRFNRQRMVDNFSWNATIPALEAIYYEVLEEAADSAASHAGHPQSHRAV